MWRMRDPRAAFGRAPTGPPFERVMERYIEEGGPARDEYTPSAAGAHLYLRRRGPLCISSSRGAPLPSLIIGSLAGSDPFPISDAAPYSPRKECMQIAYPFTSNFSDRWRVGGEGGRRCCRAGRRWSSFSTTRRPPGSAGVEIGRLLACSALRLAMRGPIF